METRTETAQAITENVVYLMGFSFVLGCFFTILLLILLDTLRRQRTIASDDADR